MGQQKHRGGSLANDRQASFSGDGTSVGDVAGDLLGALADGAQIVVCDLTVGPLPASAVVEMFGPVVRYLSDWPGAGVVVICSPQSEIWSALAAEPHPDTLVLGESAEAGLEQMRSRVTNLQRTELHLAAQLTSPRASRLFVARALFDWRLVPLAASASLVVSELVTNSVVHAASTVDVTLSRADGRVQIMVRDHGAGHPKACSDDPGGPFLGGRGLLLVEEATRGWGVFPATPGGKTVWAVFDAPSRPIARKSLGQA